MTSLALTRNSRVQPATVTRSTSSHLVLHTRVVTGSGGGPDKTILNSPRFLRDTGYPMLCAYMRHPSDAGFAELERRAIHWDAPLAAVDDHGPLDWKLLGRFKRLCDEHSPAIWHGHDYKSNLLGLMVRRSRPIKLVTTVHGWVKHTWKTPVYYGIDRFCLKRFDQVICVSQDLYDACLARGVAEHKLWHVPNAIDTEEFQRRAPSEAAKKRLGVLPSRILIGAVGRLSEEKGFDLLLRAMRKLVSEGLDVELHIAGDGGQQQKLKSLIQELYLTDRVKLLGFCSNPYAFYEAMDVFALSSLREGLPNVLLEAMAMEVPVLSTRVAGIPKLIQDGRNGLLVEPGSVDALAASLSTLVRNAQLRQRLGAAGRKTIADSFSFAQRMEKIREIYDATLGVR